MRKLFGCLAAAATLALTATPSTATTTPLLNFTSPANDTYPLRATVARAFGSPSVDLLESWTYRGQTAPDETRAATWTLVNGNRMWVRFNADAADDRFGGASMTDSWIRFTRPTTTAELETTVTFNSPWDWGNPATGGAGKIGGIGAWQAGRAPGGGVVGPANFSVEAIWQGYRVGRETLALYIYAQPDDTRALPGQSYAAPAAQGYLRLIDFRAENPTGPVYLKPDQPISFRVGATLEANDTGWGQVWAAVKINGVWKTMFDQRIHFLAASAPKAITHTHLRPMYGGGAASAPLKVKQTSLTLTGWTVRDTRTP